VRMWMLLGVLGLAGCDPMAATLQRLAPLARAFVKPTECVDADAEAQSGAR